MLARDGLAVPAESPLAPGRELLWHAPLPSPQVAFQLPSWERNAGPNWWETAPAPVQNAPAAQDYLPKLDWTTDASIFDLRWRIGAPQHSLPIVVGLVGCEVVSPEVRQSSRERSRQAQFQDARGGLPRRLHQVVHSTIPGFIRGCE